jgi:monoamine oxidase
MPRTPLFQYLVDVAAAAGASVPGAAGVTGPGRPSPAPSRREFVGGALAALGLAACERVERVAGPAPSLARAAGPSASVAIVGAGLAGLTCAYRLKQAGIVATVYEASSRLGGRCWTRRGDFADGQIAEHGGELIDQSHSAIRKLAQELGLRLDNVLRAEAPGAEPFYHVGGAAYTFADATRDMKAVWQKLQRDRNEAGYPTTYASYTPRGQQLDRMSIADWIAESVPGGLGSRLGRLLAVAYEIEYGAPVAVQSALNLIYLMGFSGQGQLRVFGPSNEKYHVRGGNDQIVSALAAALEGQIVRGAPLIGVTRQGARTALTFAGSAAGTVVVDRAVLALPFSVLRATVDLQQSGFGPRKRAAIAELGMGMNTKLNVQFASRHWETLGCGGDTFADTGYQATWEVSRGQPGKAGILVDYTGGKTAENLTGDPAQLAQTFRAQLDPVLPGIGAVPILKATLDHWPTNPWSRGSYSFYRVGQYTAFGGAEAEVDGTCHFAGEHTSTDAQGYLEGAVESGERAAREIGAALSAKAS